MSNKSKVKDISDRDSSLARMITWLDGYAEFHIVDPARVERLLKSHDIPDLNQTWKNIEEDVTTITDLPASSAQVKRYSRMSSYARLASVVMVLVSFVFLEIYFFHSGLKRVINPILALGVIIIVLYISLMVNIIASRRMNSEITKLYKEHTNELSKNRNRIRQSTQALIDRLQRDVISHGLDPSRFKFELFYTKYNNINLIEQKGSRYLTIVRAKSAKKD